MIQERYGYAKERARKEIDDWYLSMDSNLTEQIETLRSGIQSLSSTVERIAQEQFPRARSRATEALNEAEGAVTKPAYVVAAALGLGLDWCSDATIATNLLEAGATDAEGQTVLCVGSSVAPNSPPLMDLEAFRGPSF